MIKRNWIAVCVLAALLLAPSAAAGDADEFHGLRQRFKARLVEEKVPSLAIAVSRGGKILWEEGFGWADRENLIPATEHTMYSIASVSKPITATGLMVLVERDLLKLDSPINEYLGDAKLRARVGQEAAATVRLVANHSSGLPLHYHFFYQDEPHRPPSMDETIRRYGNLVFAPGEKYQYSNLGYGVLDHLISRLSGKSYSDFMRQEVFQPLGMNHTSIGIGTGLEKHQAIRYGTDGLPIPFYDFDHRGGSAVFSSAHDLVRFGMFHLKSRQPDQKAILSDESIDQMQRATVQSGGGAGYGVGWSIHPDDLGFHAVSHGGGMGGVSTLLTLITSEKLVVAVLTNSSNRLPRMITQDILAHLLLQYAKRLAEARNRRNEPPRASEFKPGPELAGTWIGKVHTYEGDLSLTLWIKETGEIHAQLGQQLKTLLNYVSFQDGYLRGRMMGDIGTADANRRPYHLHLTVKLRDRTLNGSLTAISLEGRRVGNALSHWVEMVRQ